MPNRKKFDMFLEQLAIDDEYAVLDARILLQDDCMKGSTATINRIVWILDVVDRHRRGTRPRPGVAPTQEDAAWRVLVRKAVTARSPRPHHPDACIEIALQRRGEYDGDMIGDLRGATVPELPAIDEIAESLTAVMQDDELIVLPTLTEMQGCTDERTRLVTHTESSSKALYRALRPGSDPSLKTVKRLLATFGFQLVVQPIPTEIGRSRAHRPCVRETQYLEPLVNAMLPSTRYQRWLCSRASRMRNPEVNMEIRRFRTGDEFALFRVFFAAVHCLAARDYTYEQVTAWAPRDLDEKDWAEHIQRIRPFVAISDGECVGYADIQPDGLIDHFFVAPGHANRGVGTKLMGVLLEEAKALGIATLRSHVSLTAEQLFLKHGFEVIERQRPVRRGVVLDNALMFREIKDRYN